MSYSDEVLTEEERKKQEWKVMEERRQIIDEIGHRHDRKFSLVKKTMTRLERQNDNFLENLSTFRNDRKSQSRQGSQAIRALNAKPGVHTPNQI